jgi:hypothetical protein
VHGDIFVLLLCSTAFVATQDPHAQLPDVGRAVRAVHMVCGFLPLGRLITGGLSMMDCTTLMALVDRSHLETHTFHLPCGETTVTLQDITMILGILNDGTPVCGTVSPGGWRDSVGAAISM